MKKISLLLTLVLISYFGFSQNWQERKNNSENMNFYEIQNSFNQDLQCGKVTKMDREYKQYLDIAILI